MKGKEKRKLLTEMKNSDFAMKPKITEEQREDIYNRIFDQTTFEGLAEIQNELLQFNQCAQIERLHRDLLHKTITVGQKQGRKAVKIEVESKLENLQKYLRIGRS